MRLLAMGPNAYLAAARHLATNQPRYVDSTSQIPASSLGSAWVLPTDAAPSPADERGHKVVTDGLHDGSEAVAEVLSPHGRTMYLLTTGATTDRQLPPSTSNPITDITW